MVAGKPTPVTAARQHPSRVKTAPSRHQGNIRLPEGQRDPIPARHNPLTAGRVLDTLGAMSTPRGDKLGLNERSSRPSPTTSPCSGLNCSGRATARPSTGGGSCPCLDDEPVGASLASFEAALRRPCHACVFTPANSPHFHTGGIPAYDSLGLQVVLVNDRTGRSRLVKNQHMCMGSSNGHMQNPSAACHAVLGRRIEPGGHDG